jgi:membrane protein YdbS with pleckstrin-like domain
MTYGPGYSRYSGVSRVVSIVIVVWLIIGAIAAGQRGYYTSGKGNCASFATITVTILAGPLNYVGANPKAHCPQPSK